MRLMKELTKLKTLLKKKAKNFWKMSLMLTILLLLFEGYIYQINKTIISKLNIKIVNIQQKYVLFYILNLKPLIIFIKLKIK